MNIKRRMLLLLGILAMSMGSIGLGASIASAQDGMIETSITVLETGCVGSPSELSWSADSYSIPQWAPRGNPGEFLTTNLYQVHLDMNVGECVEGWTLTGAVTDLTSEEGNSISGSDHFILRVNPGSYAKQVSDTELCMFGTCWYPAVDHLGAQSPVPYGGNVTFSGTGPTYTADQALLIGDATATGELFMEWQARLVGIEHIAATTPPGTYTGELTVTFTPTAP